MIFHVMYLSCKMKSSSINFHLTSLAFDYVFRNNISSFHMHFYIYVLYTQKKTISSFSCTIWNEIRSPINGIIFKLKLVFTSKISILIKKRLDIDSDIKIYIKLL